MRPNRLIVAIACIALTVIFMANPETSESAAPATNEVLALTGAKIYIAPDEAPIANGIVVMRDGKIVTVAKANAARVPANAKVIDAAGLVVTAGFQNSHVHFMGPGWQAIAMQPAAQLQQQVADMLTRYGVTTAVDTGSSLSNTLALRQRIEAGEVPGPRVLTAGTPFYPENGIPFYLQHLPPVVLRGLYQPATADEAVKLVQQNVTGGTDIIKLFTGSLLTPTDIKSMSIDTARAAATETHRQQRLVFSHPSNTEGIRVAIAAGVDVLAHTAPNGGPWDKALITAMRERNMAVVPTLKLWAYELTKANVPADAIARFTETGVLQLKAFAEAGGQVLFGTDVGYMTDYDPTEEYVLMARAGLSPGQILTSLTTAPADKFGEKNRRGRVAAGMHADLVVLSADPAEDVRNFAKVRYTIRGGRVIYPRADEGGARRR